MPLRDRSPNAPPHPLPITIHYIIAGIKMLRAAAAAGDLGAVDLFRGMRNVNAPDDFLRFGGTELAPSPRPQSNLGAPLKRLADFALD